MTFEQICKENYSRIFKYIYAITCDRECAENLTQEVFYIALKKGDSFLSLDTPEAFLYKTAKNLTLEHFRKSKKYRTEELDDNLVLWQNDIFDILCKKYDDTIDLELYQKKILDMLSEEDRQLYHAYYTKGLSMREIAGKLKLKEAAVRMRYVRLRKRIRQLVKELKLSEF